MNRVISHSNTISLSTKGFGDTQDITNAVAEILDASAVQNGLVTVFCQGSTGTITTIEFEPGVIQDLKKALEKIAPSGVPYEHDKAWQDGNGFSHVRAALMKPSLTIPIIAGKMQLGTWQQIVFIDFDNRPRNRKVLVQVMGKIDQVETPTIIGLTAGTLTTLSLLPQVIKAWKSKSTKDISLGTYCAFTVGLSLWVVYGIELNSPPIIITNVVTLILAVMILLLKIKHG